MNINFDEPKTYIFQLAQKVSATGIIVGANGQPTGDTDPPFTPRKRIKNPCLVYDEVAKRERWLRLLDGYDSVWQDEQEADAKIDPKLVEALLKEVWFNDGNLWVKTPIEKTLLKFLVNHDDFEGKTYRRSNRLPVFKLLNPDASSEQEAEDFEEKDAAIERVKTVTKVEDYIDHIEYMGVSLYDPRTHARKSDKTILIEYRKAAERNPKVFNKTFDSPVIKLRHQVKKAIENGVIDLDKVKGQAHWKDTGALITVLDTGKNTIEFLADFALSEQGKNFRKKLAS